MRIPGVAVPVTIAFGVFLLQFMVQGAWGVVPVHLNELSPPTVRAIFPAFAYQLGNLFAAYIIVLEANLAQSFGTAGIPDYSLALAIFAGGACLAVAILAAVGREAKGVDFMKVVDEELAKETATTHR